jgi:cystathionine beta-lyase
MMTSAAAAENEYNDIPTYPVRPSFRDFQNQLRPDSQTVVFDGCPDDPYHPSSMPIYQTSTFVQPTASQFGPYDYTRSGNPTRTALEKHVALLESAHAAFAFTTGMAALNTLTNTLLKSGDTLIIGADIYGGMHRLACKVTSRMGVEVKFVDTTDLDLVAAAITPQTRLVHIESPSNPLMRVTDLRSLSALLHARGVLLSVDSTMMSPYLMKPLSLGADVVIHSATK